MSGDEETPHLPPRWSTRSAPEAGWTGRRTCRRPALLPGQFGGLKRDPGAAGVPSGQLRPLEVFVEGRIEATDGEVFVYNWVTNELGLRWART